jgi:deglycase
MAEKRLHGMRVAILATNGFEQSELLKPREALHDAGARVDVLTPDGKDIYGMKHHDKADTIDADGAIKEADPKDYDAVMLPGGALNADALRIVPEAQEFVRRIDAQEKPIAVICHGPWLLVSAKVVHGRKLTSWPTVRDDIINAGGAWEDREVVHDRNLVSSRKPDDLPAFNRTMLDVFEHTLALHRGQRAA